MKLRGLALTAFLAFTPVAFAPAAFADVPPPPEPLPLEADADAQAAAAARLTGAWALEVVRDGETYGGELVFQAGNRFTQTVRRSGDDDEDARTGAGVWGIIETDGARFKLALVVIEREKRGGYDADDALVFDLTAEGETVLKGELLDGREASPATLTRR